MPLLCYLHFSFIFDKTYVQKNMKTKLIEKAKQISTEYKFGDFFRNFLAVILGIIITFAGSDWITEHINPEKPDVPLNKNDAFQKVQKRRVQEKR